MYKGASKLLPLCFFRDLCLPHVASQVGIYHKMCVFCILPVGKPVKRQVHLDISSGVLRDPLNVRTPSPRKCRSLQRVASSPRKVVKHLVPYLVHIHPSNKSSLRRERCRQHGWHLGHKHRIKVSSKWGGKLSLTVGGSGQLTFPLMNVEPDVRDPDPLKPKWSKSGSTSINST